MRRRRLTTRQRRERARRKRFLLGGIALVLTLLAVPTDVVKKTVESVAAFAGLNKETAEMTLPSMEVYALQLGVFDSGELAQSEQRKMMEKNIPCMIWQREKMRLICAASTAEEKLPIEAAGGQESCVIQETLPEVSLELSAGERDVQRAVDFLRLPDDVFLKLANGSDELQTIIEFVRHEASREKLLHPDNELYVQLAQSLLNWCVLMEQMSSRPVNIRPYAAVTMCTLCRELRQTLLH